MKLAVLLLAVAYGTPFGDDRSMPEDLEIADAGRSRPESADHVHQTADDPGAQDGPGKYKKNGELRQPRTQAEKDAKSEERKRLKALEKEQAKADKKQAKKDEKMRAKEEAKQAKKDAKKSERKIQRAMQLNEE